MKCLLVTSRVTFVPQNYGALICGLAKDKRVAALLILENRDYSLLLKAAAITLSNTAPRIGASLLKNSLSSLRDHREECFKRESKPVYSLKDINSDKALRLLREEGFDLVINARTRSIYREEVLKIPRYGCINIHHGILPDQRGVFCDLWALSEGRQAGFTVHRMSKKLDDGEILKVQQVDNGSEKNYMNYLLRASELEAKVLSDLLDQFEGSPGFLSQPNLKTAQTRFFKNPLRKEIRKMRKMSVRL